MSNISTKNTTEVSDIEACSNDQYYVKLLDEYPQPERPQAESKWSIGWLSAAFLSLFWFTASNYTVGTQKGDIYAGKVANSMWLGLFAVVYTIVMVKTGNTKFIQTLNTIQSIFGTRSSGIEDWSSDEISERERLKAIAVSFLCGLINAFGMTALYIAFDNAGQNGLNISVCSAILSGNWVYGLIASFTVFQDRISIFQTLGVFINLGGVLIISLGNGGNGATFVMILGSATAATWIGIRIILSRYCTRRLDPLVFMNINFMADFIFGLGWILISVCGWFELNIQLTSQLIVFGAGIFAAGADIFLFIGIEKGVAGAVVAIAGSNGIIIGILNWLIQGAMLSSVQVIAIILAFIGILVLSLGDIVFKKVRKTLFS